MYPGKYDIKHYQGATLNLPIWYRANGAIVDLTGYSAKMQLRTTVASGTVVLELSTANNRILLGDNVTSTATNAGDLANIQLVVSTSVMAAIPAGSYVYDLDLIDTLSQNTPILFGGFLVTPEVTR